MHKEIDITGRNFVELYSGDICIKVNRTEDNKPVVTFNGCVAKEFDISMTRMWNRNDLYLIVTDDKESYAFELNKKYQMEKFLEYRENHSKYE